MAGRVALVDTGGANIASLDFALRRLGHETVLTHDAEAIRAARHVIMPGVGAASDAMARLKAHGLEAVIPTLEQPVLGICLGMQLLFDGSDEGDVECLGLLPGRARRFADDPSFPVPQMGWNELERVGDHPLLRGVHDGDFAYFIHSYALPVTDCTLAAATYGMAFSAVVGRGNFLGTQFHPERSGAVGARILGNFLRL